MTEIFNVGDNVELLRKEGPYFKRGEIGQIVELGGRGRYKQALVQSFEPSAGDGRWWTYLKKIKKVDISGKRALSVGQKVVFNGNKYLVAKIDEMRYSLICITTGVATKEPINSLYLEDFFDD